MSTMLALRTSRLVGLFALLASTWSIVPVARAASEAGIARHAVHRSFPVTPSEAGMQALLGDGFFGLPRFYAYDASGRQVLSQEGYEDKSFREALHKVLEAPEPTGAERRLSDEIADLVDAEGAPVAELPEADVTLVKLWADWCMPCHAQTKIMHAVLADYPEVRVNILEVEADPQKNASVERSESIRVDLDADEIDPEVAEKLRDPSLSQEERQALVTKLYLQSQSKESDEGTTETKVIDRSAPNTRIKAEDVDPEIAAKLRDESLSDDERRELLQELMRKVVAQQKEEAAKAASETSGGGG